MEERQGKQVFCNTEYNSSMTHTTKKVNVENTGEVKEPISISLMRFILLLFLMPLKR